MAGKRVLPLFGGGPAVWTTAMLFFQVLLLAGYAYAHLATTYFARPLRTVAHLTLLAASFLLLPRVAAPWTAPSPGQPATSILFLLASTIGLPYFLLAATSPLIQTWVRDQGMPAHQATPPAFDQPPHQATPPAFDQPAYRFYALSNAASFLALLAYPVAVEPWISLRHQFWIWIALYIAYALSMARASFGTPLDSAAPSRAPGARGPYLYWIALAACGSTTLLAVTNQMCQEVAVIPFLWVLPLALYLLTFTICFDHDRWYRRLPWFLALSVLAPVACALMVLGSHGPLVLHIVVDTATLAAVCMICHGELARSKPTPAALTAFYLAISAGGALGGVFVALIAPAAFSSYAEFPIAIGGATLLALLALWRDGGLRDFTSQPLLHRAAVTGISFAAMAAVVTAGEGATTGALAVTRNFYGILRVTDLDQGPWANRRLTHGTILHGLQFLADDKAGWPTTYFGEHSGIGLAMTFHPRRFGPSPALRSGVIGLGAGTIAAYGRSGDVIRFYEINPEVERISRDSFTFRRASLAQVDVALGDARVVLEREAPQSFDVLTVDAFSSDAIPAHLLTAECADIYRRHLRPDGVLAVHISNRSLNLMPVVRGLAGHLHWRAELFESPLDLAHGELPSTWVVVTHNQEFWNTPAVRRAVIPWPNSGPNILLWTDDFTSLWRILKIPYLPGA